VKPVMKQVPRSAVVWLVVVTAAGVVHAITGRVLGSRDLVAAVLMGRDPYLLLGALALLLSRLFLYLLAPGWALHIAVRSLS
jgi:hypothetical protein